MSHDDSACIHCHGSGHISRDCPHGLVANRDPRFLPVPDNVARNIQELSSFALLTIEVGLPSLDELREMLGYRFDVWDWTYEIKRVSINRFMVKFPSDELLDQAVELSPVNLGSFVGRFRLWREDLRLRALPYPMFRWVRLFNLPYHLWELEFLQSLFEGIGQCVYCSADVTTKTNFRDCRVLLEIREYSDIPKRIRFRYTSPMDRRLMEGFVVTQLVGGDREQQANNEQGPIDMSVDQPQSQQPQPSRADPELIEVSWDGRQMTVEKELWQRFLRAQGVGPSTLPRDRGSYHDRASSKGSGGGAVGP